MRLKVMKIIAPLLFLVHQRNPWNLQGYAAHPLVWQFSSPQKIPVVPKQLQNNWKRPEARQIATSYTGLLSKLASHYKPAVFCAAALRLRDRNFEQGRPSGVHCFHQAHLSFQEICKVFYMLLKIFFFSMIYNFAGFSCFYNFKQRHST